MHLLESQSLIRAGEKLRAEVSLGINGGAARVRRRRLPSREKTTRVADGDVTNRVTAVDFGGGIVLLEEVIELFCRISRNELLDGGR